MKRHKFTKWNKERISVYVSAIFVFGVCAISGLYAMNEAPSRTQYIDMESVGENDMKDVGKSEFTSSATDAKEAEPEAVTTGGASNSPMPTAPTLAAEYAERMAKQAEGIEENHSVDEYVDLTGDADYDVEELAVPTTVDKASKVTPIELHLDLTDGMTWPVQGNVILNYSMDERAYLATLNEYRYYPAIAISAAIDAPVCAAAKGKVTKVGYNEEIGQYIMMDLGDNYEMTYGQLKDATVKQGDIVSRGQIIGNIAEPTKYYSVEGSNLYVKLEHEGESMDPVVYFR